MNVGKGKRYCCCVCVCVCVCVWTESQAREFEKQADMDHFLSAHCQVYNILFVFVTELQNIFIVNTSIKLMSPFSSPLVCNLKCALTRASC